jgi:hypothetical protein
MPTRRPRFARWSDLEIKNTSSAHYHGVCVLDLDVAPERRPQAAGGESASMRAGLRGLRTFVVFVM